MHMFYDGGFGMGCMGGMHGAWWIFWILFIGAIVFVAFGRGRRRETPHDVLQRRLASGEITPEEYEKRKALLDRDVPGSMG